MGVRGLGKQRLGLLLLWLLLAGCGPSYRQIYGKAPAPEAYEAYLRARLLREEGAYLSALGAIRQARAVDPRAPRLALEEVDLLRLSGARAEAQVLLGSLSLPPALQAERHYLRALIHLDEDRAPEAWQALLQALRLDPAYQAAALRLTDEGLRQGRLPELIPHLQRLVELHPQDAKAWATLGHVAFGVGDFALAEQALSHHLRLDQRSEKSFLRLAEARVALGDWEGQEEALAECLDYRPLSQPCRQAYLAWLLANPGAVPHEDSIKALQVAIAHDMAAYGDGALIDLAQRLLARHRLEVAVPFVEIIIDGKAHLADLAYYLAAAQAKAGQCQSAGQSLRRLAEGSELQLRGAVVLVACWLAVDEEALALAEAERLLERFPGQADAYVSAARTLMASGRLSQAEVILAQALEEGLATLSLALLQAELEVAAGRIEQAIAAYLGISAGQWPGILPGHEPLGGVKRRTLVAASQLAVRHEVQQRAVAAALDAYLGTTDDGDLLLILLRAHVAVQLGDLTASALLLEQVAAVAPAHLEVAWDLLVALQAHGAPGPARALAALMWIEREALSEAQQVQLVQWCAAESGGADGCPGGGAARE